MGIKYRDIALELLKKYVESEEQVISEFSLNKKKSYEWLKKEILRYAKKLNVDSEEALSFVKYEA